MEKLINLYTKWAGSKPASWQTLKGAGSNRTYVRIVGTDSSSVIGVIGTSAEENDAFCYIDRHFDACGISVPHLLMTDDDGMRYLQSDLGSMSLYDALKDGREHGYDDEHKSLLAKTVRQLVHIQYRGAEGLDFDRCYPQPVFDRTNVMFDLNYFKYCFLKATGVEFNELRLEEDFVRLAEVLVGRESHTFMYRDFQARNVMLVGGEPVFIDFQGGRRGPVQYDLVSFLWQASARYPQSLRDEMIAQYCDETQKYVTVDATAFRQELNVWVLFRTLQVLGAYGFRGYFERKKYFLDSIPPAIDNLRALLAAGVTEPYPYLSSVLSQMAEKLAAEAASSQKASVSKYEGQGPLVVRVNSFSYKKGIPDDPSGNGGGYVFDCRSTHNPGRYEPYKKLTGLDEPVIRFLEDNGEILTFLQHIYKLADSHTARYIERGFTSLMFSFGCTGGQHRSVYCAQHLAEHLHEKFGIKVIINHREQNIHQEL